VAAVPYDVVDSAEAAALAAGNPYSFLHVSRPEIDLEEGIDLHDDRVYAQAKAGFDRLCKEVPLVVDAEKHLYEFYKVFILAMNSGVEICGDYPEIDQAFDNALSDDFNTALALSELFAYFKKIKALLTTDKETAGKMLSQIKKTYSLLGLFTKNPMEFVKNYEKTHAEDVPEDILNLANQMQSARLDKNYQKADELRAEILNKGYQVMISKDGVTVKKC
jgi:cysteinyl-tRNA synthetase